MITLPLSGSDLHHKVLVNMMISHLNHPSSLEVEATDRVSFTIADDFAWENICDANASFVCSSEEEDNIKESVKAFARASGKCAEEPPKKKPRAATTKHRSGIFE